MNIFNALKKPKIPLAFMLYWTVMTWVLTPIAIRMMGAIGFVYVQVFLSSTCFVVMAVARKYLQIDLLKNPFLYWKSEPNQ